MKINLKTPITMRLSIILIILFPNFFIAQDRLSFVTDVYIKEEIKKSIQLLEKTTVVPSKVKNKVIFITFDIEQYEEGEGFSFTYSTTIPMLSATVDAFGQIQTKGNLNFKYFNYSKNIVLVFRGFLDYFNLNEMYRLSKNIKISKERIISKEFFHYNSGNDFTSPHVENSIILRRNFGEFNIIAAKVFDVKTFNEIYEISSIKVSGVVHEIR